VSEPITEWSATFVESPDAHLFDGGPGLFDVNEVIETLTTMFDRDPEVRATMRRTEDADNLGPYLSEAMRRVSVQPQETPVSLRFLDPDTAELNLVVNLAGQPTPFVGRVARHGTGWLVTRDTVLTVLRLAGTPPPTA
jgi:hypothetical protein